MKKILFLAACFLVVSCQAQQAAQLKTSDTDNTLLWEVSGNGLKKPSFLFGTFHLLCKEDVSFSNQLKTALQQADTVYMEMKMDDPSVILSGVMYMNMKDGKSLQDLYTPEQYSRLKTFFQDSLKMPFVMFDKMKPYLLISLLYPRMMDCGNPSGVEMELIKVVKEYHKQIKGLETIQFQASIFDSIPYDFQAKELLKNIDSLSEMKDEFNTMVKMYKEQRMDTLAQLMNESEFSDDKYGKILLVNRNRNWVHKLDQIMKRTSVFVAVGAGHLPGKDGLINLLREMGYTVSPLENVNATKVNFAGNNTVSF